MKLNYLKKSLFLLTFLMLTLLISAKNHPTALPTLTTTAITNLSQIRANSGGNVTDSGGLSITNRGIVWGTSVNPTIDLSTKTSRGRGPNAGGIGSVVDYLTPLQSGTVYHVRAYATNSAGTAYGNDVTFTTASFTAGRKYYFSSNGNDANATNSITTPWQTLSKLYSLATSNNGTIQPGDTIAFRAGDVFNLGSYDGYAMCYWANYPNDGSDTANYPQYYTAPSGTKDHPIVWTSYNTGAKPNFYFRDATVPTSISAPHNVFVFGGLSWLTIDGLQFNDTRFPASDIVNPAYTTSYMILGEIDNTKLKWNGVGYDTIWGSNRNVNNRKRMVSHVRVQNCLFSNASYGMSSVYADSSIITQNVFTNLKSSVDTIGVHDIMAGPIDGLSGMHMEISYNYFKTYFGKSGRVGSCQGLGGVALDIFSLKYSRIAYNTFIDGRHPFEIGNLDRYDSTSGSQYDTFAYNKIIGNPNFLYIHGSAGDVFQGNNHNLHIWNNVIIENQSSRLSGPNFGYDRDNNGVNFSQLWFFKNKNKSTNYQAAYGTIAAGGKTMTVTSTSGIYLNSRVYAPEGNAIFPVIPGTEDPKPEIPKVKLISGSVLTLDSAAIKAAIIAYPASGAVSFTFYPPLDSLGFNWSQPPNPSASGNGDSWDNSNANSRPIQYSSDAFQWGMGYDTLIDSRNNIFYYTNGEAMLYDISRTRYKHNNNIYYLKGNYTYTTNKGTVINNITRLGTGAILGQNERIITSNIFVDTTAALPENWNLKALDTSYAVGHGSPIKGFTVDFAGNAISNPPSIGLFEGCSLLAPTVDVILPTSGGQGTAVTIKGTHLACATQLNIKTGTGLIPTPLTIVNDSTITTIVNLTQAQWTNTSPSGAPFIVTTSGGGSNTTGPNFIYYPPVNLCTFLYSAWTTCVGARQTRTYTSSPAGCSGTPPVDSLARNCTVISPLVLSVASNTKTSCLNKSTGSVVLSATGGVAPYSFSKNSTSNYTLNKTIWSSLGVGQYTFRVKDAAGTVTILIVTVTAVKNINC